MAIDYELLDFGQGRKLERFGLYVLDRPSPAAKETLRASPELWRAADARFERTGPVEGRWQATRKLPEAWLVSCGRFSLEVRLTPFGHVGLFPEQAENWAWIAERIDERRNPTSAPCRVLNLFAYTGASTLATAAAGAEVTHVDAAKSAVSWARASAERSGLIAAPVRWIIEDVRKFISRELRRGKKYDAVILDPPSYGHGPAGEAWKIDDHLPPLLADCARLTEGRRAFFVLTCHSPGYGPAELASLLVQAGIAAAPHEVDARTLHLSAPDGRVLPSGAAARWGG